MAAFNYLVQVPWGRFWLIAALGAAAAGLTTGLLENLGFLGPLAEFPIFGYLIAALLMTVARVVVRGQHGAGTPAPAHAGAAAPADAASDDLGIPPPEGRLAYASYLLARTSWAATFALSILILVSGMYSASLIAPKSTPIAREARPVKIVVIDSRKDQVRDAIVHIDDKGIRVEKGPRRVSAAAGGEKPGAFVINGQTVDLTGMKSLSIGKDGVLIETEAPDGSGTRRTVRIDTKGMRVEGDDIEGADAPPPPARPGNRSGSPKAPPAPPSPADAADDGDVTVKPGERNVVQIDLGQGDPTTAAKALREALRLARGSLEAEVRDELEAERAAELNIPWHKVVRGLTLLMVALLIGAKLLAGSHDRTRVAAYRATLRAEGEALKRQLSDAQLKAMQAQVEPHFLFNTLASVDYLIETAPKQASKMQKSLITYLRNALPQMRQATTTLGREMQLVSAYLDILKVRMEERLEVSVVCPPELEGVEFPPMMLQTLVENAIKHGLEPKPEGGSVHVLAERIDGGERPLLRVSVADTGIGLASTGPAPTRGTGLGLNNIRERLQMLYPGHGRLTLSRNLPSGTLAVIELPLATAS
jgi:signal transduction histidine kinase